VFSFLQIYSKADVKMGLYVLREGCDGIAAHETFGGFVYFMYLCTDE